MLSASVVSVHSDFSSETPQNTPSIARLACILTSPTLDSNQAINAFDGTRTLLERFGTGSDSSGLTITNSQDALSYSVSRVGALGPPVQVPEAALSQLVAGRIRASCI